MKGEPRDPRAHQGVRRRVEANQRLLDDKQAPDASGSVLSTGPSGAATLHPGSAKRRRTRAAPRRLGFAVNLTLGNDGAGDTQVSVGERQDSEAVP
jgi:hypothetical protein